MRLTRKNPVGLEAGRGENFTIVTEPERLGHRFEATRVSLGCCKFRKGKMPIDCKGTCSVFELTVERILDSNKPGAEDSDPPDIALNDGFGIRESVDVDQ